MAVRLSFNLFSEPTIFPDDHVRYPAVDSGTSGKDADPSDVTLDDFDNPYSIINLYYYIFIALLDIVFLYIVWKNSRHKLITIFGFLYFFMSFLEIALRIYVDVNSLQICDTPWICYEGGEEDDTLEYSSNLYIFKGQCFDRATSIYDYADNHRDPDVGTLSCHDSKYGCCYLDERCSIAVSLDYTYSQFINNNTNNHAHHHQRIIPLAKKDQTGSNCPLITDLIEDEINNEKKNGLKFLILKLILNISVYISLIYCINPRVGVKYEKHDNCNDEFAENP